MLILFRYQLRAILARLVLCWPALALLYVLFELGDQGRRLAATAGWGNVVLATLLHLPLVAVQVLPAALLLAALLAVSRLRQAGELEAVAVAGGGPTRLLAAVLTAGLLVTGAAFVLGELVSPPCERRADRRLGNERASALTGERAPSGWLRQGRCFVQIAPRPDGVVAVLALEQGGMNRIRRTLEGRLDRDGERIAAMCGRPLEAGRLAELRARPEALSTASLHRRVVELRASGRTRPAEELLLHTRLVFPLLNLLVVMIAWNLSLCGRGRALLADLVEATLWMLGLFVLLALGWLLARAGWMSPAMGAWLPLVAGTALASLGIVRRVYR